MMVNWKDCAVKHNRRYPVYMMISKDRFQLPLAVADSVAELSRMVGVNADTIAQAVKTNRPSRFIRVWLSASEYRRIS